MPYYPCQIVGICKGQIGAKLGQIVVFIETLETKLGLFELLHIVQLLQCCTAQGCYFTKKSDYPFCSYLQVVSNTNTQTDPHIEDSHTEFFVKFKLRIEPVQITND